MPFGAYDRQNKVLQIYRDLGIDHALMVLTNNEIDRKARKNLRDEYQKAGITFSQYPVRDFQAPSMELVRGLVAEATQRLGNGQKLAVHCHAGVGRTAVAVSCIIARVQNSGANRAIEHARTHMPVNMTPEQISAIRRFVNESAPTD